ncbi:vitamin K epoxide reductase family protein [Chryseoglobus sp. 28M-23]|uniref:vitamin K epoxide reductase family protein n=1 Tax=Chryseoglobus sp. 28M-23 TaxID=2772253 RepID=UPI001CD16029|nr:vitamin K epoxide reductase family protein [Chryseoglobus sp. 28M-23]
MSIPTATTTDHDRRPIGFGIFLIVTGAVAWYAAMQLITERVALLIDPSHVLNCDVNPLVSCGTVMASPEASLFGFPNPLLGVAGLVAPIAVGVALLARARFARWFWALFLGGVTLAWVFVMWLFGEAVYDIGALCPWCMLVWLMVIPMFWWLLTWTLSTGVLAREGGAVQRVAAAVWPFTWTIVFVNLAGIALAILVQFPTLIPSLLG